MAAGRLLRRLRRAALGAVLAASAAVPAMAVSPVPAPAPEPSPGRWRDASPDDYRKHLSQLIPLVEDCARARDLKNCDPLLVGPDDRVPLGEGGRAEPRLVRYGWLRVLFSKAEEPDEPVTASRPQPKGAQSPAVAQGAPATTSQLLAAAQVRLAFDLAQASRPLPPVASHAAIRGSMERVLAGRDFRSLEQISPRDAAMEKISGWLNHLLQSATRLRARSAWIGWLFVWGFVLTICVLLVLFLLRLERRWRLRLPAEKKAAVTSASARDWQLWLADARRASGSGQWREAIHFVYWAVISRLESRRLWPADRARTPREYLALVAPEDPRRNPLAALTGSFERTWYGGRAASEVEYRHAEQLASSLIEGGAA